MKSNLITLVLVSCLFACTSPNDIQSKSFVPGTFVRSSEHQYGKEFDTLIIATQNDATGEYKITRRWRYERVLDGQPIEPKYELKVTAGRYDKVSKLLKEEQTGNAYSFDPSKNLLYAGTINYQKIR